MIAPTNTATNAIPVKVRRMKLFMFGYGDRVAVNVALPRLIVAGRQVKRRFTAGLKAAGQRLICFARLIAAELLVNVAEPRLKVKG